MSENAAASPQQPSSPRRRPVWAVGLGLLVIAAGAVAWWATHSHKALAPANALALEKLGLSRPDALLESTSLSRLPKDLLSVPFLRETLTEDFVFYYEAHADRLGLIGSLRRIVYEHDLHVQDNLIEQLLDQPADVALWRGADGRLRDFLLVLDRGGLAKIMEPIALAAMDDKQLSKIGELKVAGDKVPLYRLNYNYNRSLLFASRGDKLVVLSNPDKFYDPDATATLTTPAPAPAATPVKADAAAASEADGEDESALDVPPDRAAITDDDFGKADETTPGRVSAAAMASLLNGDKLFPEAFGLAARAPNVKARISVGASVLAMGYQRFIPNFSGLRFDMDEQGWHSFLALDEQQQDPNFDFQPIWQAMPMGASACVALPVIAEQQQPLLVSLGATAPMAKALTEHMNGAAGLCWYADSRLYTPLLVAQLDDDSDRVDGDLGKFFDSVIGADEPKAPNRKFPVQEQNDKGVHQWQRQVSSNFGQYAVATAQDPQTVSGKGFFKVNLARHGSTLVFSLDDKLVQKSLSTLDKHFPPLADVLPKDAVTPLYFGPASLAQLMQQETLDSLPQDLEPVFRNAAQTFLLPKLTKLSGYEKYALTLPAGSKPNGHWQWLPLQWRAL